MSHKPKTTRWALEDHSRAKHEVLQSYLGAWLPILGFSEDSFIFLDGFAGPGHYSGGEEGSPLIALRTFLAHPARPRFRGTPSFLFVEGDAARAHSLEGAVEAMLADAAVRPTWRVDSRAFHDVVSELRAECTRRRCSLKPAFVMIDPFGISDSPMDDIRWLMSNPKCEVYISLMASFIARFEGTEGFDPHLDALYGTHDWSLVTARSAHEKLEGLLNLYESQLRKTSNRCHVLRFDLFDGRQYKYTIFHAASHERACERMKQAIWSLDATGSFRFRGRDDSQQLGLFGDQLWLTDLRDELLARLANGDWHDVVELVSYLQSDETRFHPGQLKKALRELEGAKRLEVEATSRSRRLTYPDGTRLRTPRG